MPRTNTESDFWSNLKKTSNGCWEWIRSRSPKGYGKTYWKGMEWRAHRLAHFLTTGEKPPLVCHSCDNPPCCNPAHLWAGTYRENNSDRAKKKRSSRPQGEKHPHSKLTEAQVLQIRKERAAGKPRNLLAKEYGIHPVTVTDIVARRRWKHLS